MLILTRLINLISLLSTTIINLKINRTRKSRFNTIDIFLNMLKRLINIKTLKDSIFKILSLALFQDYPRVKIQFVIIASSHNIISSLLYLLTYNMNA